MSSVAGPMPGQFRWCCSGGGWHCGGGIGLLCSWQKHSRLTRKKEREKKLVLISIFLKPIS